MNLECLSLEGNFSNFLDDRYLQGDLLTRNALSRLRIFDVGGTRLTGLTAASARRLAALPALRELRLGSWAAIEERAFKVRNTGLTNQVIYESKRWTDGERSLFNKTACYIIQTPSQQRNY